MSVPKAPTHASASCGDPQACVTEHFAFLLVNNFSHLAFSCAVEPLRIANLVSEKPLYRWSFASMDGEFAECSNQSLTKVHYDADSLPDSDRLFILSGLHVERETTPELLALVRRQRVRPAALGALCSGAYILAKAGLLDGHKAAIHWEFHDSFMEQFPFIDLTRNVFVADAPFVTASGGTATADLMLHLIAQKHGRQLALDVADQMVYNAVRDADAEQRISMQARAGTRNPHLVKAIQIMNEHIEDPIPPVEIAAEIGISVRQLERIFGANLNCSPKKYYLDLRLQRARHLLVQTEASIIDIAMACGFESSNSFSRAFRTRYGNSPSAQKTKAR